LELRIVLMKKLEIQEIFQLSWSSEKKWETIGSALGEDPNSSLVLFDLAGASLFINLNDIQKK